MPAFKPLRHVDPRDLAESDLILGEIWSFLRPSAGKPTLLFAKQHASASAWLRKNAISIRYDSYRKWNIHVKRSVMLHEVLHLLGMHHLGFGLDDLAHMLRPRIWGLEAEEAYRRSLEIEMEKRLGHRISPEMELPTASAINPEQSG